MGKPLTSDEFLRADEIDGDASLEGAELQRVFWALRGSDLERRRREAFWEASADALARAYDELERKSRQLEEAHEHLRRLNAELEERVATQVEEIVSHAHTVDALNEELKAGIRDRSRELALALRRLAVHDAREVDVVCGDVFGGRARIIRLLGRGGMGSVYLAADTLTGREVALKVMRRNLGGKVALERFIGEARAASAVTHPAITRTHHIDVTEDGRVFQLMDYVAGVTLESRLVYGVVGAGVGARLGAVLANGLGAAHAAGVVHRDVKPSNIMLCDAPGVRILDFGVAKIPDEGSASVTGGGYLLGTAQYMAPEQIGDPRRAGPASDIYGLGTVLFEMLTGRPPFLHGEVEAICVAQITTPPPDPRELVPNIPEALARAVVTCLAKRPADRPDAVALGVLLDELADRASTPPATDVARQEIARVDLARAALTQQSVEFAG